VEDEEEEGEKTVGEQDISTKIHTHELALHCISEVMQFGIDANSSSLLELSYAVKTAFERTRTQESGNKFVLLDLWKKSQ
jgi:hypothetical protein